MKINLPYEVQVLLPVYNEAKSIEQTINNIYVEISKHVSMGFIICEDGSTDGTKEILIRLCEQLPITLVTSEERKGYSQAVKDGMKSLVAPFLLCLDSDGQCDPSDFWSFWKIRSQFDVVIGWRVKRADVPIRKVLSRIFFLIYQAFFHVPIHDPSCPYILANDKVIQQLAGQMNEMQQGFWWEFTARVYRSGFSIKEIPIHHRLRTSGVTQVYRFRKMPGIGYRHFLALYQIWKQTQ